MWERTGMLQKVSITDNIPIIKLENFHIKYIEQIYTLSHNYFNRDSWSKSSFLDEIENEHSTIYVAIFKGNVIGFIAVSFCFDLNINLMAIEKDFRHKNIGTLLIKNLLYNSKKLNCSKIMLEVRQNNVPAINFYTKMGFHIVGRRKNFYTCPNDDAILMDFDVKGIDLNVYTGN